MARTIIAALLALIPLGLGLVPGIARAETRIALVIGNAGYQAGALNTPANDAGLIAQTLEAAGFDVAGARDLDQDSLRRAFRDFLEKATNSGPDTVAVIYISGYGLQLEGENYIVPIDAKIARDADVAAEAVRVSDYTRPLAALKLKASIVVLDAARANPFARSGPSLAGGLALIEPDPGFLVAFNAAPGTVAPEAPGPYGPYAQALAEMIREGGLPIDAVFERARLRVNDLTKGAQVPWHASKVETSLVFFERAPDAPPSTVSPDQAVVIRSRPIRELPAQEAYIAALDRDTIEGYSDFLAAYPDDPMARRVRAIIAARREALTWRRTRAVDTPPAYWSYLRRYPQGPHAADAHRRLAFLAAAFEPPPSFAVLAYDLPPPPPEEIIYVQRPVLVFDDPIFAFAPPPPVPVVFLAPPPPEFVLLPPPPPPVGIFVLPMPVYRPVPVWVRPPAYVAPPPPNNVIYTNIHNTVVINNVTNTVTITNPSGQTQTVAPPRQPVDQPRAAPGATPAAPVPAVLGPALPPSIAQKAAILQSQTPQPRSAVSGAPPSTAKPLPGMHGQPLPPATGAAAAPTAPPLPTITPGAASTGPMGGAKPGRLPPSAVVPPASPPSGATLSPASPQKPLKPSPHKPIALPPAVSHAPPAAAKPLAPPSATVHAPPASASPPSPAAKLAPPVPPVAKSVAPPSPVVHAPPASASPPSPAAKLAPPVPPVAKSVAPPSPVVHAPPRSPKPPPPAAKLAPPPPPPVAKSVAPLPSPAASARPAMPPAPAAAAAKPMPPPTSKPAQPQPKGCPPGKSMAVVNGQPACK